MAVNYRGWNALRLAILSRAYEETTAERNKITFWRAVADTYERLHPVNERRSGAAISERARLIGLPAKTFIQDSGGRCGACKGLLGRRTRTGRCLPCYSREYREKYKREVS